ncbi:GAF domain-containing SpoIIE family protein phosphatase [Marivirga arenosa]|uniref:PP2C family protein-serine/threonine phosphatase n=1 Tax=Marivirga arenosa TaxID=3059076 RepID=A0AA49GEI9_9BACT|nr:MULTISPECIES: PP2C family protein-serine/threonine phosphatase [unclassified Marivirga]WKK80513.2 PP2C family protein-serine/threonine phosphatase [Marivirga sp. BKB1-2]WMN06688.1 PP2C family protein-serine/threonine phosphatase [Marivirga sp. ABR2-2]
MSTALNIANRYELKELELDALLEITQAINENLPEESLYKIYNFTLRANLKLSKLMLVVQDDKQWIPKLSFGTKKDYNSIDSNAYQIVEKGKILFPSDLVDSPFDEFDVAIPVYHKNDLLAVVFLGGVANAEEREYIENHLNFIQALSNIIMVAIENKKMARERLKQEVIAKEMEIAKKVQQLLFPKSLPENDNFSIDAHYSPHHTVGGDYYDWKSINEHQKMVCIADVSGKGVPAALLMSNFQASLRTLLRKTTDLEEIIHDLNYQVFESAKGENFITFFIAIIDLKEKTLKYVNAGHNPPFLVSSDHSIEKLEKGTLVLGALNEIPFLEIGTASIDSPQTLLLYTDGLTEAFNEAEEEFGPERVMEILSQYISATPERIISAILDKIDDFIGKRPLSDDITLLACKYHV